jgi:hypothetical protein
MSQPTKDMVARAESWCVEHSVPLRHAPDLAEVFYCWAAEYERRGARKGCGAAAPEGRSPCAMREGHEGAHYNGGARWPNVAGVPA